MTYLEKAMEIKKDQLTTEEYIMSFYCPSHFDLEDSVECDSTDNDKCTKCWKREMPDTEIKPKEDMDREDYRNLGYNQGLNDAWELAKRIYEFTCDELEEIFGVKYGFHDLISKYTPQEALAKMKAYEEAQSKIEVGDVVELPVGTKCVVTSVKNDRADGFTEIGYSYYDLPLDELKKTGKHIDISSILEQIGE